MREDCRLTGRERMALDGIERLPRHEDRALARRLRTMRLRTPAGDRGAVRPAAARPVRDLPGRRHPGPVAVGHADQLATAGPGRRGLMDHHAAHRHLAGRERRARTAEAAGRLTRLQRDGDRGARAARATDAATPAQAMGPSGVQPKNRLTPGVWMTAMSAAAEPSTVSHTKGL